jgi:hypothetical protein
MPFDWETFTYDETWLRDAVRLEAQSEQDVQIGVQSPHPLLIKPTQLRSQLRQVKILSMLFSELRYLLEQANLGSGTEAAFVQGRQLIQTRLSQLGLDQQKYFEALFAEQEANLAEKPLRSQLHQRLCSLLTESDWQEIAQAAMSSIQAHLLEQITVRQALSN